MEENRFSVLCHCCHPEPVWMDVFWKSDSSSRISARISCCSIARFYLLHLKCHPFSLQTNWPLENILCENSSENAGTLNVTLEDGKFVSFDGTKSLALLCCRFLLSMCPASFTCLSTSLFPCSGTLRPIPQSSHCKWKQECISVYLYTHRPNVIARGQPEGKHPCILAMTGT